MSPEFNIAEATLKMKVDAEDIVRRLDGDKKYKGETFTFEHNGKLYDLTLSRSKRTS